MNKEQAKAELEKLDARRVELEAIINKTERTKEQVFLDMLNGCTIKIDKDKYPRSVFLFKEDKYFFEIENSTLWCSWSNVWSIEKEFSMSYNETQTFIKNMVEQHFKMKDVTPVRDFRTTSPQDVTPNKNH